MCRAEVFVWVCQFMWLSRSRKVSHVPKKAEMGKQKAD